MGVPVSSDGLVTGVFEWRQWWVDYWASVSGVNWCLNQPHAASGWSVIAVKPGTPTTPAAESMGSPRRLLTPRGHSMSPKMFLMQPTRYSCRSSVMPSKFLHARITTSRGWLCSHSEISVSVSWAGVARRALCERQA